MRASISRAIATAPLGYLLIWERGRRLQVNVDAILMLTAGNKYVTAHTAERDFLVDVPLNKLDELLSGFIRADRHNLIASKCVIGVDRASFPAKIYTSMSLQPIIIARRRRERVLLGLYEKPEVTSFDE